jgi:RNA polymerase sigma-70 factor (ECF subfamily)
MLGWASKPRAGRDRVDDIEIVKSVEAGDSESFSLLVDKYHRHLLNFIYRPVGDAQIVEDIGQEVFLSVCKSLRAFDVRRGVPFSAWLFIGALRRKNRSNIPVEAAAALPAKEKTPEEIASDEERILAVHAARAELPEPYRRTIVQSLRGDSPGEIALDNRISRGTVTSRLSPAPGKR